MRQKGGASTPGGVGAPEGASPRLRRNGKREYNPDASLCDQDWKLQGRGLEQPRRLPDKLAEGVFEVVTIRLSDRHASPFSTFSRITC